MSARSWLATIDFETRSKCDLKKAGAWRYSRDVTTDALCLAYALDQGEPSIWRWLAGDPPPVDLFRAIANGVFIEAHNVFFEWCIWENVMRERYGWPPLPKDRLVCSAARAAFNCLPRSLEFALPAAGLDVRKADSKAMRKLTRPRKPTKNDDREWHEEPELYQQLYDYCVNDVVVERELSDALPALPKQERRLFTADFEINRRGLLIDVDFVKAALQVSVSLTRELSSELAHLTDGQVMAATERDRVLRYLAGTGLELDSLSQEHVEDLLYSDRLTKTQRRILEIRQEGSRSSVSKYSAFLECVDSDNVVRGMYMYYGANAHGRFSGRLVQPQNFPRGNAKCVSKASGGDAIEEMVAAIKEAARTSKTRILREQFYTEEPIIPGDPLSGRRKVPAQPAEVLSTALRGAFIARPGRTYGVGDYSAIEARVLFWLAEEEYGLSVYRDDGDIYRDMGSVIFGKPPEDLDVGFERMMGKTTVLGCGYGMGWIKFQATCKTAYGMEITESLCKKSVYAYRKRYAKVPKFWENLEAAARAAIETGLTHYVSKKRIAFSMRNGTLVITLPSGREIYHRAARIRMGQIAFINGKGFPETTYGGKLCEYIVSGTARDMLGDAIVKAEYEYDEVDPVMHSHDELVCEGEPGHAGKLVEQVMSDFPSWSDGLPMKLEVWEGARYHK